VALRRNIHVVRNAECEERREKGKINAKRKCREGERRRGEMREERSLVVAPSGRDPIRPPLPCSPLSVL
jgi:hypothetical protein